MLFQNPDSESTIIVIILIIAVFILVILLIATFALLSSEAKAKNKIGSKDEIKPTLPVVVVDTLVEDRPKNQPEYSSPAWIFARLFPEDRLKNALESSKRAIVDRLRKATKNLNWTVCLIIATCVAVLGFFRVLQVIAPSPMRTYFICLAIVSPTCIGVAWLRLTGLKWRKSLSLFVYVPAAFIGILFIYVLLGLFFGRN